MPPRRFPPTERADDRGFVQRVAQAMLLSLGSARVRYVFDTFMDVDRGYFPRHGFIDRRCDMRPAARAFQALAALLSGGTASLRLQQGDASSIRVAANGSAWTLLSAASEEAARRVRESGCDVVHDLVQGTREDRARFLQAIGTQPARADGLQVLLLQSLCA